MQASARQEERPAADNARQAPPVPSHLRPIDRDAFGYSEAKHLLWRAGFGGTPAQVRMVADWGPERAVGHLVRFEGAPEHPVADRAFESNIIVPLTPQQVQAYRQAQREQNEVVIEQFRRRRQMQQATDRRQILAMQKWWLERLIESPRPLEERMTLFWHSHFATSYRTTENSYHMFMQNKLFRENAVGNFGELLFRIIRDPAMIAYLDNNESRRGAPNENLARELMELFSLGEGGYEESDIKEGARALTGYTFVGNEFFFRQEWHDDGPKEILGKRGNLDGDGFVRAILGSRRCSEYVCMKLYEHFVATLPAPRDPDYRAMTGVIERMARTMREHRYDLAPVLSELFQSEHFYHQRFRGERIKSPTELVVGAVRSLNTPVRSLSVLNDAMDLMGQRLFFPPNVSGWAEGRSWINTSTLFTRQNIMNFLLTGKTPSGFDPLADIETFDPDPLLADLARADPGAERDATRVIEYIGRFMLPRPMTPAQRRTLTAFVDNTGGRVTPAVLTGLLVLISAMPEYQLA
jgi:uncharacterized protein (DUF1800 family)